MSEDDDARRVHFLGPDHLIEQADALAEVLDKDRTDIIIEALREYIAETTSEETIQQMTAQAYYEDRIDHETVVKFDTTTYPDPLQYLLTSCPVYIPLEVERELETMAQHSDLYVMAATNALAASNYYTVEDPSPGVRRRIRSRTSASIPAKPRGSSSRTVVESMRS